MPDDTRIDRWLCAVRLVKTRPMATQLCDGGHVRVNGNPAKTSTKVRAGDVLIGLPSTGLHTNGYSLARKLLFEVARYQPNTWRPLVERAGVVPGTDFLPSEIDEDPMTSCSS